MGMPEQDLNNYLWSPTNKKDEITQLIECDFCGHEFTLAEIITLSSGKNICLPCNHLRKLRHELRQTH